VTRPATVRFYFDADVLGLAKTIVQLRSDATYPGDPGGTIRRRTRPACEITTETPDAEWIPLVARSNWLIVTRDRRIQERPAELAAVREHSARMIALASREAVGTWDQLEVFMSRWRSIEALLELPGPFIYTVARTAMSKVPLD